MPCRSPLLTCTIGGKSYTSRTGGGGGVVQRLIGCWASLGSGCLRANALDLVVDSRILIGRFLGFFDLPQYRVVIRKKDNWDKVAMWELKPEPPAMVSLEIWGGGWRITCVEVQLPRLAPGSPRGEKIVGGIPAACSNTGRLTHPLRKPSW